MKTIILATVLAAFAATSTLSTFAAEKPAAAEKKETKPRALPYQGKIVALDQQAKTVKVGEKVFQVSTDTKITKNGQPATLADAAIGEQVGISYRQGDDKTLNLVSLRIGPKPEVKKENKK
jgi:hypothetical protein